MERVMAFLAYHRLHVRGQTRGLGQGMGLPEGFGAGSRAPERQKQLKRLGLGCGTHPESCCPAEQPGIMHQKLAKGQEGRAPWLPSFDLGVITGK